MRNAFLLLPFLAASAQAEFTCTAEGIWADPDHCENFIQCTRGEINEDGTYDFNKFVNTCPETTLYEACDRVCEDPDVYHVECGPRPHPDGTVEDPNADIYADCPGNAPPLPDGTTASPPPTTTENNDPTTTEDNSGTTNVKTTTTTTPRTTTTDADATTVDTTLPPPTEHPRFPEKIVGFYITLADDFEEGFETEAEWDPVLYEYQQTGANVLFFTFVNPATMAIPKAFVKLAGSRGTGQPGAVPADTVILFAIGGYAYSYDPNPWDWLTSRDKAEAMAEEVAQWRLLYNCDGIDLDIESGAGDAAGAGENMNYFVQKLRELDPDIIIGQPTFGYPQVQAEIDVINASWNVDGSSNDLADSVGIMVYEGATSLDYVENYAHGSEQWEGFPITVNVPYNSILVGSKGISSDSAIDTLASEVVRQDLLGIMVWFNSVQGGLAYDLSWDTSQDPASQQAYIRALETITA